MILLFSAILVKPTSIYIQAKNLYNEEKYIESLEKFSNCKYFLNSNSYIERILFNNDYYEQLSDLYEKQDYEAIIKHLKILKSNLIKDDSGIVVQLLILKKYYPIEMYYDLLNLTDSNTPKELKKIRRI